MGWFQDLQKQAARTYGAVDKNAFQGMLPGGASREAGQATPQAPFTPGRVMQRGALPVVTVVPEVEGVAKFLKSYAGPLGRPFDVQESFIGRDKYFNEQIQRGTKRGNTVTYGTNDAGYVKPQGTSEQLKRGIVGQFTGNVDPKTGAVTLREGKDNQAYDTNRSSQWHGQQADKAWGDPNNKLPADMGGYLSSKFYQSYAALQEAGWTNQAPMGTQVQTLGNINGLQAPVPTQTAPRLAGQADITVQATAQPGPAMNYAVKAGDTLTSIAAANGITVQDLARKNNIANVDLINVGQKLKF